MKAWLSKIAHSILVSFICAITFILPTHGKRIFFLTTLFMQLTKLPDFEKEVMDNFNRSLNVADNVDALRLPSALHCLIWNTGSLDSTIRDECGSDDPFLSSTNGAAITKICERIAAESPRCLSYGRREDMVRDLLRMFGCIKEYNHSIA